MADAILIQHREDIDRNQATVGLNYHHDTQFFRNRKLMTTVVGTTVAIYESNCQSSLHLRVSTVIIRTYNYI